MRLLRMAATLLVLCGLVILAVSCSSNSSSTSTVKTQTAAVKKGNLSVAVTGTGNLAYSRAEDLAFQMAGTVQQVMVKAGESVKEGQELAKLDTSVWDKQVKTFEKDVTTAERNLVRAERQITSSELGVQVAQLNLLLAQSDLQDKTLGGSQFKVASDWYTSLEKSRIQVQQSQMQVEDAQTAVTDAHSARDDAEQAVKDAQAALDEAKGLSPIIKAPFAGFITKVNVKGGDEILKGTVAVQLADPNQFEANILVTEKDVFSVKLDGDATVSLDALSGLSFPAKITAIAPLATTQQGVVNYKVTVKLASLQSPAASRSTSSQVQPQPTGSEAASAAPSDVTSQRAAGAVPPASRATGAQSTPTPSSSPSPQNITLRDGLTAVVKIIVQQKNNVLVVPNRAITRQGQNNTVQVSVGDTTETRVITTGMSDNSNTEVTGGLSEGDLVVIKTATTSASSTTNRTGNAPAIGGIRLP